MKLYCKNCKWFGMEWECDGIMDSWFQYCKKILSKKKNPVGGFDIIKIGYEFSISTNASTRVFNCPKSS